MKRLKNLLSVILCLAFIFSAASCTLLDKIRGVEYVPEHPSGYTGGFYMETHFYEGKEIHWIETYDEAMYIIEQLKVYDNEFSEVLISSYENEIVDAKYCFIVSTEKTRKQKEGEEWYQRKFHQIGMVGYYAFLDDVTIEELEYSDFKSYRSMNLITMLPSKYNIFEMAKDIVFECENDGNDTSIYYDDCTCLINNANVDVSVGGLNYHNFTNHYDELPENFHDEFLKSLVVVGGK